MKTDKFEALSKKEREDKITNRVLINLGFGMLGYLLLYIFNSMISYGSTAMPYIMLGVFAVFAAGAIACYIGAKKKPALKNYGHMLVVAAIVAIYLNFAMITYWVGLGSALLQNEFLHKTLTTTSNAYQYTSWGLGIYLVAMIVYNIIVLHVSNKRAIRAKSKNSVKKGK